MKKLLYISLFICATCKCVTPGTLAMSYYMAGVCMVPFFDRFWYDPDLAKNGFYISQAFDPRMASQGIIDFRTKWFYKYYRIEPGVIFEWVGAPVYYNGLSIACDYQVINRRLGVLLGTEITRIWNQNGGAIETAWSTGINTEIRFRYNHWLSFSYIGNIKNRPEITKELVYSGYLSANFKIY